MTVSLLYLQRYQWDDPAVPCCQWYSCHLQPGTPLAAWHSRIIPLIALQVKQRYSHADCPEYHCCTSMSSARLVQLYASQNKPEGEACDGKGVAAKTPKPFPARATANFDVCSQNIALLHHIHTSMTECAMQAATGGIKSMSHCI